MRILVVIAAVFVLARLSVLAPQASAAALVGAGLFAAVLVAARRSVPRERLWTVAGRAAGAGALS
jgi:hypothetical protein